MTEREAFTLRLKSRLERLQKLVALNAPAYVIGSEIILLERAMWGLDAEAMGQAQAAFHRSVERGRAGRCAECGAGDDFDRDSGLCLVCLAEARAEDGDSDGEDAAADRFVADLFGPDSK